jgi:hypothetical protein
MALEGWSSSRNADSGRMCARSIEPAASTTATYGRYLPHAYGPNLIENEE